MKDVPNRDSAITFMDFLPKPEDAVAVSNCARHGSGLSGVGECLDPEFARRPTSSPPATAGLAAFAEVSDEATRAVYDQNWTNVKM